MFGWLADYKSKFDLEVDVYVAGDEDWGACVWRWDDRGGRFEEEEGVLGASVVQLGYVVTGYVSIE